MIIDLCSGLGRWKSAKQDVISIDFNSKTKPTIVADIRHLPLKKGLKPDLVHASPPCKYLTEARLCRGEGWKPHLVAESLRIIASFFEAIDYLEPKMWTMEQPDKSILRRIIPTQIKCEYSSHDMSNKKTRFWSNNRGMKRAIIPQDVRNRILKLVDDA